MSTPTSPQEQIHLTADRLKVLLEDAVKLQDKGHARVLAEALSVLEQAGDPIHVLRHLLALPKNGYTQRPQELAALNDVGRWLERRLYQEPGISTAFLAQELGWLRRLGRYHEAVGRDERRAAGPAGPGGGHGPANHKPGGISKPEMTFGKDLADLEKRRKAAEKKK